MKEFPSSLRLDFPNMRRLVLLSIDLSLGKHREIACYKGFLSGEVDTLSFWIVFWLTVVYRRGLIDFLLLSLT